VIGRTLVIALLVLAAAAPAAVAAPWSAPRSLTVAGSAGQPAVALGAPDLAAVAYVRTVNGEQRVELWRGTIGTLGAPVLLDRDRRLGLESPALTFDGAVGLVAWRRLRHVPNQEPTRVIALASVGRSGAASAPRELTGPPNAYDPRLPTPQLLVFNRRTTAYVTELQDRRVQGTTRLPAGATFDVEVARLADGTLLAVWPQSGVVFSATKAPGALAFGAATRLSTGGYARSPRLAVTTDGHAVAVWTQSDASGRALLAAARPPGGTFGASTVLAPPSAEALSTQAIATTAGDVFVTYVSSAQFAGAGPLRALRVAPDGLPATSVRTLTAPGERTHEVSLAVDSGAGYAAWSTAGRGRRSVRVVRVAPGAIVGTVRTVSAADDVQSAPPAFAMTADGRALIAYATKGNRIRLVTRAG
jgi:hypothetical protein